MPPASPEPPAGTGRVALVSGGSRGIGRAVVLELAAAGYDVSFCYHASVDAAEAVEKEVAAAGRRVLSARVDVADLAAVRAWVERTEAELGPVATVVASAGVTRDRPLALMSEQEWHEVLDTNLDGVHNVFRSVVFGMMKRKAGCLVAISSVAGVYGNAGQTNYSASKAGIIGLSKALAKEVGRYGIRVNVVAPGMIDTDMVDGMPDAARAKMLAAIPLGRAGTAEEVAALVGWLAGDRAGYVTGAVLQLDGGISI